MSHARPSRPAAIALVILASASTGPGRTDAAQPDGKEGTLSNQPAPEHTNRLIHATSPYLLQHAHNPVDWYEWGPDALAKAKKEDKPIFLSIGYAACHWCHVMEHESFETQEVADVLNAHFIAIKVDREERPDLDEIYMAYTQALTQHGGWPMSVWLTPDATPFYAGTYFPKAQLLGILQSIAHAWQSDRQKVTAGADGARDFFQKWSTPPPPTEGVPPHKAVDQSAVTVAGYFDRTLGGIGSGTNKFPPSMAVELLLRVYRRTGDKNLYEAVDTTLDHMARGGIYDQLGGGICRYSTDPQWLVPHFEKMLYDQALVGGAYLDAYQTSKNPAYADVAADIFDYVIRDLQSPEGGFYSSRDADSDGMEGAFYIWTKTQVLETLGDADGELFCEFYDVSDAGNWTDRLGHAPPGPKNILHLTTTPQAFARSHALDLDEFNRRRDAWKRKLLVVRDARTPPALDDKILTGWNGLMIAALAKGARVLDQPAYARQAARAADFVLNNLNPDGRLLRSYRSGKAHLPAYLSDYAFFIEGLLNLYEATFDQKWLTEAAALTDTSIKHYYDKDHGAFYFTASDADRLIARSKQAQDGAIPSGNAVHAMNLLRLAILLDRKEDRQKAESIFRAFGTHLERAPGAFERLLCALDFYHDRVKEIAIIGDPAAPETAAMIRTVYERYLPNKVVVGAAGVEPDSSMPLLKGKTLRNGRPTAYVCQNYRCRLPVTDPEQLAAQLDAK